MSDEERAARVQEILGDELVRLIDRRSQIWREFESVSTEIYASLVNRMQSQSAVAMIRPYETLENRLDRKRETIADLRAAIEELRARVAALEKPDGDRA
jgi:chromosome segregation ATPase